MLVKEAVRDPDVAYTLVADNDGKILAQSDPSATEGPIIRPKSLLPLKDAGMLVPGAPVDAIDAVTLLISIAGSRASG